MITIFKKEINEFLNSLIAYISIGVFLTGIGMIMWVFPDTSILDYGYATMEPLFTLGPYVFIFLIPAITMRSFAEEKRNGTIELLYTLPIRSGEIIAGKFIAAWAIAILSLVPTLIYYYSVHQLGNPVGNLDTSGIIGSYIGLLLLGAVFSAIGIFASAITENQIVSFVLSAFACFLFYQGFEGLATLDVWGTWAYYLEQLGISFHYNALSKGLLALEDIVFFLGYIGVFLMLTKLAIESKKW